MPYKCSVPMCRANYRPPYVSCFKFPSNIERRKKWLSCIRRKDFVPSGNSRVCINHFAESMIIREDKWTDKNGEVHMIKRKNPSLTNDAYPCFIIKIFPPLNVIPNYFDGCVLSRTEEGPHLIDRLFSQKRNKKLAEQRAAGLLTDAVQEAPIAEQIFIPIQQTSSAQTYSEYLNVLEPRTLQDIHSSQVPLSSVAVEDEYVLPHVENAVESSSAVQKTLNIQTCNKHLNDPMSRTLQGDIKITEVITNVPLDNSSTQVSLSSSVVKDNCTLPLAKGSAESSSTALRTSNFRTYSKHTPVNIIPQDINSLPLCLSCDAVKDSYKLPLVKNIVENSYTVQKIHNKLPFVRSAVGKSCKRWNFNKVQNSIKVQKTSSVRTYSKHKNNTLHKTCQGTNITKIIPDVPQVSNSLQVSLSADVDEDSSNATETVSKNDPFTLPSVSNIDTCNLPVVSNSCPDSLAKISGSSSLPIVPGSVYGFTTSGEISKDYSSVLINVSANVKDTNLRPRVVKTHHPVTTQKDFHSLKKNEAIKLKPLPKEVSVCGRRIIDFQYFFRALKEVSNHSDVGCNLNNMIITSEKKSGLCTSYCLKCVVCDFEKEIWSENQSEEKNLNNEFVSGMFELKLNFQEANLFLAKMHLPSLSRADFQNEFEKVSASFNKKTNQKISQKNVQAEHQLTAMQQCSYVEKNVQRAPQLVTMQQCSSASDNNILLEQDLDDLLVEDQIEIKEENVTDNENESEMIVPDQSVKAADNKSVVGQEQVIFTTTIKQEIISDDEDFTSSTTSEIPNKESIQVSNILVKRELDDMEITDKESTTHLDNESELTIKKARMVTDKESNNLADTQKIQTIVPKSESNGLTTVTSSTITEGNGTTTSEVNTTATTNAGKMQYIAKSDALITPSQMPHNVIASGIFQDAKGATLIPATSTVVQQHSGQSSSGLLPLVSVNQSWTNSFSANINNPLILLPGASGAAYMSGVSAAIQQPTNASGITYVPIAPTVVQQPVSLSNSVPGMIPIAVQQPGNLSSLVPSTSGTTYIPLTSAVIQPPADSSAMQPVNTDGSRWIGRENMDSNNPFCTLPGGAPKGASDPATSKTDSDQSNHQSKRTRFRCDDCDISFAKHESWDSHKKNYCIKRLKVPPSSTVTNLTLMNNSLLSNCMTASVKPHIDELLSAMAIKRSFLEASIKTALDAQYVINLHKSAQDLTQKSFKELDDTLNREKALMPEASLEKQQIVSEARAQALMRAEAAYKQEKHSAAAVEQALYRQKTAIEATLAATGHEQTALISTLRGLKEQANQNDTSSIFQTQWNEACFNQEKLLGTSLEKITEQQQVDVSTSSKSTPVHTKVSNFDDHSKSFSAVNLEERKAVTMGIQSTDSSQCEEISTLTSYSRSNAPPFQNFRKRLPSVSYSQNDSDLNVAISAETSLTTECEKEKMTHDYSHLEKPGDINARNFPENTYVTFYQADKCFTQRVNSDEMMDINITPSSENNL